MTSASFIKRLCLLTCMEWLAACSDTPGFKEISFQGSANKPATPSIVQAYQDMVGEMLGDTIETASMDRTLHGVRQTRDTLPHPGSGGDQTAEKAFDRYQPLYFK